MRVLYLSNTDTEGARFNGHAIRDYTNFLKVEMVVWNKKSHDHFVYQLPRYYVTRIILLTFQRISVRLGFDGLTGLTGFILPFKNYFRQADIFHIQQIHNHPNFSILSLPFLSKRKPIVWTIHDPWAITGGCEHSFDCERWLKGCKAKCPNPRRNSLFKSYTPHLHWKIKKFIYHKSKLNLVVASKWMKMRVEKSPLLSHFSCHLIPFGIDLEVFKPLSKSESRTKLGIPVEDKVIVFRGTQSGSRMAKYKGHDYLVEALKIFEPTEPTTLIVIEHPFDYEVLSEKYNILSLKWVDTEDLVTVLSSADIFLMPSVQETFGLMAVESMACGTPVLVFEGTALPEVIKAPLGGLAVTSKDSHSYAKTLKKLLEDDQLRGKLSKQARYIAETEYSQDKYVQGHIELYKSIVKN